MPSELVFLNYVRTVPPTISACPDGSVQSTEVMRSRRCRFFRGHMDNRPVARGSPPQEGTLQDGDRDAASGMAILPQPAKWKVEEEGRNRSAASRLLLYLFCGSRTVEGKKAPFLPPWHPQLLGAAARRSSVDCCGAEQASGD